MTNPKINVAVIMGGRSSEHDISMKSGATVISALDKNRYNVKPIKIEKSGKWLITPGYLTAIPEKVSPKFLNSTQQNLVPVTANSALHRASEDKVDVVFIALHGKYGEDGTLQGMLELMGIPYTGSGVLASSLAMDKVKSMELYQFHGFKVPAYFIFSKYDSQQEIESLAKRIHKKIGFPCVCKPVDGGSSKGTFLLKSEKELQKAVSAGFKITKEIIFQKYIQGDEVTCSILDCDEKPIALPPTQIIPKTSEFFDVHAKYKKGATEEVTPARLPLPVIKRIQKIALKVHKLLGCSGLSRTDMIIRKGVYYLLETNTVPGMTQTSLFPQAAKCVGIEFPELLNKIIEHALRK